MQIAVFQVGSRILVRIRLKQFVLDLGKGLVHMLSFSSCEFKCDKPFDLEKGVSRQPRIQGAACVWSTTFSQIYSENCNKKK